MAPRGCNRQCASCDRIIHDLAALTFDEAAGLLASDEDVSVRAKAAATGSSPCSRADRVQVAE